MVAHIAAAAVAMSKRRTRFTGDIWWMQCD
jgi:hypothetical protein